jgi:hypothetical protein
LDQDGKNAIEKGARMEELSVVGKSVKRKDGRVKEETFSSQRVTVGFIEPHFCIAEVDPTDWILCDGY